MDSCYEKKENYLLVKLSGVYEFDSLINELVTMLIEINNRSLKNLFVDCSCLNLDKLTGMERYYIGEKISELFTGPNLTDIAVLCDEMYYNRFLENTAYNRGALIHIYTDREDIKKWEKSLANELKCY